MLSVECRFARVPVGHNELEKSMKWLFASAGLERFYTNLSLRRTCAMCLYEKEWMNKPCIMECTGHSNVFGVRCYKKTTTKKVGDGFWFDALQGHQVSSAGIRKWWEGKYFNISSKVVCWKEDSIPVAGHKESAPLFLGAISTWVAVRWISPTTLTKQLLSYSGTSL